MIYRWWFFIAGLHFLLGLYCLGEAGTVLVFETPNGLLLLCLIAYGWGVGHLIVKRFPEEKCK